jgi:hypothetical protein
MHEQPRLGCRYALASRSDLHEHGSYGHRVPNHTPTRGIRVSDELWQAAKATAAEQGETVTDVVVRALDQYVRSHGWEVDPVTALERLGRLHAAGVLGDYEWRVIKRDLLARI